MRCTLLLLAFPLLLSCRHEFPPPGSNDADDRDPDATIAIDQRPARHDDQHGDRIVVDTTAPYCSTTPTGSGADCTKEESWGCVGICDGKHRYACLKSSEAREIQCPEAGGCVCIVGVQKTPCPASLDSGRLGCDRCLEALRQGCCRP
jgi:hypothetical protein